MFLVFYGCATSNSVQHTGSKLRVAVAGFSVKTYNTFGVKDIGRKLNNMFSTSLSKNEHFVLIERAKINAVLNEQRFQLTDMVDPATAAEVGKMLDAQAIITGSLNNIDCSLMNVAIGLLAYCSSTINVRIISTETGKTILTVSETGRSYTFGVPVRITAEGKTRDDVLGIKRSYEDMINSSLRNTVEKAVSAISEQI
jgi:curli biogenesis system outer membrane secretion channel CsgG